MKDELIYENTNDLVKMTQNFYSDDITQIEKDFLSVFPNGKINVRIYNGIGDPCLAINALLIGNKDDQSNGIIDNDPLNIKFIGFLSKKFPNKNDKFVFEKIMGGLSIQPEEGSYMAMGRVKLPFRKSTNTMTKQVAKLKKFWVTVGQAVLDNKDNLHKKDLKNEYLTVNI